MSKEIKVNGDWAEELSKHLLKIMHGAISQEEKNHPGIRDKLNSTFLAMFVGTAAYYILQQKAPGTLGNEAQYKFTSKQFARFKGSVEEAVAAGFQGAMSSFAGKPVEYYCQVRTVPEAVNKTPC